MSNHYKVDKFNTRYCVCGRVYIFVCISSWQLSRFHSREQTIRIAFVQPQSQDPSLPELKNSSSYDRPETARRKLLCIDERSEATSFPQGHSFILTEFERDYQDGAMAIGDAPSACSWCGPCTRASVHFVTHSCRFRSEQFATRVFVSHDVLYTLHGQAMPESFIGIHGHSGE